MSFLFAPSSTSVLQTLPEEKKQQVFTSKVLADCHTRQDYAELLASLPCGFLDNEVEASKHLFKVLPFALPTLISRGNGKGSGKGKGKVSLPKAGKDGTTYATNEMAAPYTRLPRQVSNSDYRIVQTVDYNTGLSNVPLVSSSTTVAQYAAKYFTIGDLDQVATLAAFFDQYRIDMIEVWLECATPGTYNTRWISVIDYDDANALTTYPSASDYQNAVESSINVSHYRSFVPHIAVAAYSGTFVSYQNVVAPWIDYASTAVQHYGIKVAVAVSVAVQTFNLRARFHVSNRNIR